MAMKPLAKEHLEPWEAGRGGGLSPGPVEGPGPADPSSVNFQTQKRIHPVALSHQVCDDFFGKWRTQTTGCVRSRSHSERGGG